MPDLAQYEPVLLLLFFLMEGEGLFGLLHVMVFQS